MQTTDEKLVEEIEETKEKKTVDVLTYNIFLRPPFVSTNESDHKDSRTEVFASLHLEKFDIVCLQEMFSSYNYRQGKIIEAAKKIGFKDFLSIPRNWSIWKPVDSGLLLMSKYDILDSEYIVFKESLGSDSYSTKGVISALIQIRKGVELLVFTTHLQAVYYDDRRKYANVQKSQLLELKQFLEKKRKEHPKTDILLCGDFNVNGKLREGNENGEIFYHEMLKLFHPEDDIFEFENLHDFPVTYGHSEETIPGEKKPKETVLTHITEQMTDMSLDYMFFGSISKKIKVKSSKVEPFYVEGQVYTQLSDHYGLSATLEFEIEK